MNYSLTIGGIFVSVAGTFLVQWFTPSCAGEIADKIPLLIGAGMAWYGRVRLGDVTALGARKYQ